MHRDKEELFLLPLQSNHIVFEHIDLKQLGQLSLFRFLEPLERATMIEVNDMDLNTSTLNMEPIADREHSA